MHPPVAALRRPARAKPSHALNGARTIAANVQGQTVNVPIGKAPIGKALAARPLIANAVKAGGPTRAGQTPGLRVAPGPRALRAKHAVPVEKGRFAAKPDPAAKANSVGKTNLATKAGPVAKVSRAAKAGFAVKAGPAVKVLPGATLRARIARVPSAIGPTALVRMPRALARPSPIHRADSDRKRPPAP